MVERLFAVALTNAAVATALAALLWGLCRYVRAPHLVRFLALVVLLRFLAPPLLPWGVLPAWGGGGDAPAASALSSPPASDLEQASDQWTEGATKILDFVAGNSPTYSWAGPLAGILWALGFAVVSGLVVVRERRFRAALRRARRGSPDLVRRVDRLGARLGLRRPPEVLLVEQQQSPAVVSGARRDLLLLPEPLLDELSGDELDTVIVHELAHLRRRDGWVRWIEVAACCVFWWNPAAWWTRRRLRKAEEECCDELVLRLLPELAAVYVGAIVKTLNMTRNHNLPAGASAMASVDRLEERLKMILEHAPRPRRPWNAVGVGLLAIAVLCVFPTFSQESEEPDRDVLEERLDAERLDAERLDAERLDLEGRRLAVEQRRLDEELRRQVEDAEHQARQLELERDRLDSQFALADSEAVREQVRHERRRLDVEQRDLEEMHRFEAERLDQLVGRELQIQRIRLETERALRSGEEAEARELADRVAALEDELRAGELALSQRALELEADRMNRRSLELTREARALRERGQHEDANRLADEVLLEREQIELLRAELALQKAGAQLRERQTAAEARERARQGRERARAALERADRQARRSEAERLDERRSRQVRSRESEVRRVHDRQQVSRQLQRLSQLLAELGDDGAAQIEVRRLEERLEELLEKRTAAEAERDAPDSQDL